MFLTGSMPRYAKRDAITNSQKMAKNCTQRVATWKNRQSFDISQCGDPIMPGRLTGGYAYVAYQTAPLPITLKVTSAV